MFLEKKTLREHINIYKLVVMGEIKYRRNKEREREKKKTVNDMSRMNVIFTNQFQCSRSIREWCLFDRY